MAAIAAAGGLAAAIAALMGGTAATTINLDKFGESNFWKELENLITKDDGDYKVGDTIPGYEGTTQKPVGLFGEPITDFETLDKAGFTPMNSIGKEPPENNEEKKEPSMGMMNTPGMLGGGNTIQDSTSDNVEETINNYQGIDNYIQMMREENDRILAKQEEWRKQDQERADNAYQRAIKDMYKSGIDPNQLGNITPAEVGGTVQSPSNVLGTGLQTALTKEVDLLNMLIEKNFKGDENDKDRFTQTLNTVLGIIGAIGMASGKKTTTGGKGG